ncbi:MAG TPA: MFS transporter [Gemmatimonadales bacterium]|nr:MFS transporter [Gemmatimonadales bacterium]
MDPARLQRRTLLLLFLTQVIAGVGIAVGASVGALLAAELAGIGLSGVAQSANVVGAALFAVPAATIVQRYGRRPSLAAGYATSAVGSLLVVLASMRHSVPLLFAGFFLFGGSSAAGYQARYAAVDLAPTALRGRHLSLIVWATTLGAIVGPSLSEPASAAVRPYGVPAMGGPFVFSALLLGLAALVLVLFLRPDPAVVARELAGGHATDASGARATGVRAALPVVLGPGPARLGVAAMAIGHVVMIGVMAMTPVHVRTAGHDAAHTLRVVGFILSSHIAGMFAFAPVFGWLADRIGRRAVIGVGIGILVLACAVAGAAGYHGVGLALGLMLVGLGWSATMVAGSTLLSEAVPVELRASAQGLSDLIMGLAGATAGALSGVVMELWSYPTLTLLAAVAVLPLAGLLAAGLIARAP